MQKHTAKRVLSALLASAMMAGTLLPLSVFAEGTPEVPFEETVLTELQQSEPVVSPEPETVPEAAEEPETVPEATEEPETAPEATEEPKAEPEAALLLEEPAAAEQPKEEVLPADARNIALGKLPYVYGLYPTNLQAITDGKVDDNLAVHNSLGEHFLQFEYKNRYNIKQIKFKLEEGLYKSVKVSVSAKPTTAGTTVWSETDWTQGEDMVTINLDPKQGNNKQYVRFTVNRADDQPAKYSEVEIWATGENFDESKPEYVAPQSKYNTLVWSDEFNGDKLDETKWQVIDGMNNFAAIYNPGAISVHDGYLDINSKDYGTREALLEAVEWDQYHDAPLPENVTWSSGRIESKNKFSFQNGRVAVRAKVNDSQGIWPAIWMLCQDETGHDEIDILEYLGQDPWDAHTTNHYGILNKNKGSHSKVTVGYEAWSQDFHVYEVEWDPQQITFFIDGKEVFKTSRCRDMCDGMHTRPMFLILETQVGGGWVGPVDPAGQNTKPSSSFLVDWVHVYQQENQPVARFDDLANIHGGAGNDPYFTAPVWASQGLMEIHSEKGTQMPVWQDKDYFFYGGQPRAETDRVALAENAEGQQSLIYRIPDVQDVHLTTYYQTLSDGNYKYGFDDWYTGRTIRKSLLDGKTIDFTIETSPDAKTWILFEGTKVVDNYIDAHPGYARTTFDAYGLPEGTNYVKVVFPNIDSVQYSLKSGTVMPVLHTDVQLAKVTFMQKKGASDASVPGFTFTEEGKEPVSVLPFETVTLNAGSREGYVFDGWTVTEGDVTLGNKAETSFVMPTGNVSVKANWKAVSSPEPEAPNDNVQPQPNPQPVTPPNPQPAAPSNQQPAKPVTIAANTAEQEQDLAEIDEAEPEEEMEEESDKKADETKPVTEKPAESQKPEELAEAESANTYESEEESSSMIWLVVVLIVLAVVGGSAGWMLYRKHSDSEQ